MGGGDAGIASIGLKFSTVERVTLLDIDASVSRTSRRYFGRMAAAFSDPRFQAKHVNAFEWVKRRAMRSKEVGGTYDLVVVDFTDSLGRSLGGPRISAEEVEKRRGPAGDEPPKSEELVARTLGRSRPPGARRLGHERRRPERWVSPGPKSSPPLRAL